MPVLASVAGLTVAVGVVVRIEVAVGVGVDPDTASLAESADELPNASVARNVRYALAGEMAGVKVNTPELFAVVLPS